MYTFRVCDEFGFLQPPYRKFLIPDAPLLDVLEPSGSLYLAFLLKERKFLFLFRKFLLHERGIFMFRWRVFAFEISEIPSKPSTKFENIFFDVGDGSWSMYGCQIFSANKRFFIELA